MKLASPLPISVLLQGDMRHSTPFVVFVCFINPSTVLPSDWGVMDFVMKDVLDVIEKVTQAELSALSESLGPNKSRQSGERKRSVDSTKFKGTDSSIGESSYVGLLLGKEARGRAPTPKVPHQPFQDRSTTNLLNPSQFHMSKFIASQLEEFDLSDDCSAIPERMDVPELVQCSIVGECRHFGEKTS